MPYGLPANLCCFNVPGLGRSHEIKPEKSKGASAPVAHEIKEEHEDGASMPSKLTQLPSPEPRLCVQPWSAIFPKRILEYVIIPIAAQLCPKFLKKQIIDTAFSAIEIIDQLQSEKPKNSSSELKATYLHNLIKDLNLYTSDPLVKDTAESSIKKILNRKFGAVPNEKFEERKSINRINAIDKFKQKIIKLESCVASQESKEQSWFFDSMFQHLGDFRQEADNSIRCNDALRKPKSSRQEINEYRNKATFAQILKGEAQHCDDD